MDKFTDQLQIFGKAKILRSRLNSILGPRESENISRALVEFITGEPYHAFLIDPQRKFNNTQLAEWHAAEAKLLKGMPFQYVTGQAWFMDHPYKVSPDVLVPRPETEELVRWILQSNPPKSGAKVLDIGTGSGCIATELALAWPQAQVFGMDLSAGAIHTASQNARDLKARVTWIEANVLEVQPGDLPEGPFALIVSNPPYIPYKQKAQMAQGVTGFEPKQALFVPNDTPLLFYERIASLASALLAENAPLFFEIHEDFAEDVLGMMEAKSYHSMELKQDFQGKNRMVKGLNHSGPLA